MPRIEPIQLEQATGKAKELLDGVQSKLGMTPNLMKTMAQSPSVLEASLNFSQTLSHTLTPQLREQIALLTAQENGCGYCASAHTAIGKLVGLSDDSILAARNARSADSKTDAALKFAKAVIGNRGRVSDDELSDVRAAGFNDGEVAEIVANVILNIFTNYFNEVAGTEIDFPVVDLALERTVTV